MTQNITFVTISGSTIEMTIGDHEVVHGIQIPETEGSDTGIKLITNMKYLFRCKCLGAKRALEIAKEFMYRYLFADEGLDYDEDPISYLTKVPINFNATCEDQGFGWLWAVTFELVTYGEAMNDPEFAGYYTFSASAYTRESLTDIYAVPLSFQYRYPIDHPRKPYEIVTANGTVQKDAAVFTFYLNLIKEMKYPEAAAGFISYVNEEAWKGYPPRTVKITNIQIKPIYTDLERDDYNKHYYICTFEFQANDLVWDQVVAITDPETGQHPGDCSFDGNVQDPLDPRLIYPPGRNVHVLPQFDFHRLWPDEDYTTFQERGEYEFPIVT